MKLSMVVGRDYRTNSSYEYVLFNDDETVAAREGFYKTAAQARRAGEKKASELDAADPQIEFNI